jgi:hypothetical protein
MQLGVPSSTAQLTITSWRFQDIPPIVVLQPFWVQVEGVPHSVRHFHGLWAVGSLLGATQDVDLVTLHSRGIVRIQLAMMDTKCFDTNSDDKGHFARAVVLLKLNGYEFRFRREALDFIPDPNFKPYFWTHKEKDADGDMGNDGEGSGSGSSARPLMSTATNMEVDTSNTAGSAPHGKTVSQISRLPRGTVIAVTPYNPNPCTPHGIEIVERARTVLPLLVAPLKSGMADGSNSGQTLPASPASSVSLRSKPVALAKGRSNMLKQTLSREAPAVLTASDGKASTIVDALVQDVEGSGSLHAPGTSALPSSQLYREEKTEDLGVPTPLDTRILCEVRPQEDSSPHGAFGLGLGGCMSPSA